MNVTVRIILAILTLLAALALGLLVRHVLVVRFKKASLGYHLAQAVGVAVLLLLLLLALMLGLVIITGDTTPFALLQGAPESGPTPLQGVIALLWNTVFSGIVCVLVLMIVAPIKTAISRKLEEQGVEVNLRVLVVRAYYALVLAVIFLAVLLIWDVQIALPVTIITGVLTFALRDLIKDQVAGVYILAEHQFQIGDQITISSSTGVVTHIDMRATTLRLVTGEAVIIPNGRFLDQNVRNNTRYKNRRAAITALFAQADYEGDATLSRLVQTIKGIAVVSSDEEPSITLDAVTGRVEDYNSGDGGSSSQAVRLSVRFWVESRSRDAVTSVMEALRDAFPRADFLVQEFAAGA